MSDWRIEQGNCLEVMAGLPQKKQSFCLTFGQGYVIYTREVPEVTTAAKGPGRPTNYDPEKLDQVTELAEQGQPDYVIAKRVFGVCYETLRQYKEQYPALSAALQKGRDHWDDDLCGKAEASLKLLCEGGAVVERGTRKDGSEYEKYAPPNVPAIIFTLTNRAAGRWTNTQRMQHANDPDHPFEIPPIQFIGCTGPKANAGKGKA